MPPLELVRKVEEVLRARGCPLEDGVDVVMKRSVTASNHWSGELGYTWCFWLQPCDCIDSIAHAAVVQFISHVMEVRSMCRWGMHSYTQKLCTMTDIKLQSQYTAHTRNPGPYTLGKPSKPTKSCRTRSARHPWPSTCSHTVDSRPSPSQTTLPSSVGYGWEGWSFMRRLWPCSSDWKRACTCCVMRQRCLLLSAGHRYPRRVLVFPSAQTRTMMSNQQLVVVLPVIILIIRRRSQMFPITSDQILPFVTLSLLTSILMTLLPYRRQSRIATRRKQAHTTLLSSQQSQSPIVMSVVVLPSRPWLKHFLMIFWLIYYVRVGANDGKLFKW